MLRELLVGARGSVQDVRGAAEHEILARREHDRIGFLIELLDVIRGQYADCLHLALVLMENSITLNEQMVAEHGLYRTVYEMALGLMHSEKVEVAHASAMLFGKAASVLLRGPESAGLIGLLKEILRGTHDQAFTHNVMKSIREIVRLTVIDCSEMNILVGEVMRYLAIPEFCADVLEIVVAMDETFVDKTSCDTRNAFGVKLLEIGEYAQLKESCFKCWMVLFLTCRKEAVPFLQPLMLALARDLSIVEDASVLEAGALLVETIFECNEDAKCTLFRSDIVNMLLGPLMRVMSLVSTNEPDEMEAWEPHVAARDAVVKIVECFPEHTTRLMMEVIPKLIDRVDTNREISMFFVGLVNRFSDADVRLASFIACGFMDASTRVRHFALIAYIIVLKQVRSQTIYENGFYFEQDSVLVGLINDHLHNATLAIQALRRTAELPGYPVMKVFPVFFTLFDSPVDDICYTAFKEMTSLIQSDAKFTGCCDAIVGPTLNLLEKSFRDSRLHCFQDEIFGILNLAMEYAEMDYMLPHVGEIWRLLMGARASHALMPLAQMAICFGEHFEPYIAATEAFVGEATRLCQCDDDAFSALTAIEFLARSQICNNIPDITRILIVKANESNTSNNTRGHICEVLSVLLVTMWDDIATLMVPILALVVQVMHGIKSGHLQPVVRYFNGCFRIVSESVKHTSNEDAEKDVVALGVSVLTMFAQIGIEANKETVESAWNLLLDLVYRRVDLVTGQNGIEYWAEHVIDLAVGYDDLTEEAAGLRMLFRGEI